MSLTRESIQNGYIQRMLEAANYPFRALTDAEIHDSLHGLLRAPDAPPAGDTWVFGYGSLIWNPAFHFVEQQVGVVHGYHRRFCLWTSLGRGSPETPGLILALEAGGSCRGVAFRIAAEAVETELEIVWRREMVGGSYIPRWVPVRTATGVVRAVAFTINRGTDRYAGRLDETVMARSIARACGHLGPCADYLFNTVAHLEALGIRDRPLARLRDLVAAERDRAKGQADES